jgi:hypothetical protein
MREILLIWLGLGMISMFWYWHQQSTLLRRKPLWMSLLELVLGPVLWPLAAYSAWIWWRGKNARLAEFRASGTPHCRRHGYILLKCESDHEAFCSGCGPRRCSMCGGDAWSSPRFHGRSATGEPIVVYERIYATPHESGLR